MTGVQTFALPISAQIDTYLKGFRCADFANCDTAPKTAATWHEGSCDGAATTWDHKKVATFAIKYTCTDHAGHVGTACRILQNQDKTKPVIALNDAKHGDIVTVKAAATGTFVDAGATCFDFIDGQTAMVESQNTQGVAGNLSDDQASNVSRGSLGSLETFQKYKIINAHTH